jgi:3'(2'), 5'-bisphosphate nucleotidase
MDKDNLFELVKKTTVAAGEEILAIRKSGNLGASEKVDGSIVTKADRRSQEIIVSRLSGLDLRFLGEEEDQGIIAEINERNKDSPYQVIIDPVDGTRPFKIGQDCFCVSVSVTENQRPIIGVIYAPAQKLLYFAGKGKGSHITNMGEGITSRLHTSDTKDLERFRLSMNPRELLKGCYFDYFKNLGYAPVDLEKVKEGVLIPPDEKLIFSYSTALVFCEVAKASADYAMSMVLAHKPEEDGSPGKKGGRPTYYWDLAAADIIIEEAGGCVTDFEGNKIMYGTHEDSVLRTHSFATNSPENHFLLLEEISKKIDHKRIYRFNLDG